jgi:signal transduction histidine kinase
MRKPTLTFAILSAVILLIAGSLISYADRLHAVTQQSEAAERDNAVFARVFANGASAELKDLIASSGGADAAVLRLDPTVAVLRERAEQAMRGSTVTRIDIVDRAKRTIFSTEPAAIGAVNPNEPGIAQALDGHVGSRMIEPGAGSSDTPPAHDVVTSFAPIADPGSPAQVETVLAVSSDVTSELDELEQFHHDMMLVIWVAFAGIYLGLVWIVWRSNRAASRQHETNIKLAAAIARSEASNQSKSDFLANMSHELRTPLNAIIGFSEIMKSELLGPVTVPAYRDYVGNIHDSGVHLLSIVNDILDMAKAEVGSVPFEREEIDLKDVLDQSAAMMEERAAAAGLSLTLDVPAEIGTVVSDKRRLKQILLNLLSNAIKFTPAGGKVTLTARRILDKVAIEVADTGVGIAEEDMPTALAPFGQVDSSLARKHEGTGLGLPLARKFVELLGGTFHIESRKGAGTRVGLMLSVSRPELGDAALAQDAKTRAAATQSRVA